MLQYSSFCSAVILFSLCLLQFHFLAEKPDKYLYENEYLPQQVFSHCAVHLVLRGQPFV